MRKFFGEFFLALAMTLIYDFLRKVFYIRLPTSFTKHPKIFALIATFVIGIISLRTKTEDYSTWNYILSSISQGLAALLAIVLTVTFVVTQILQPTGLASASKPILILPSTMYLFLLYSFGILIPLIVIQNPNETKVDGCIILAAFCIYSLIPYLYSIGREISTEPQILKTLTGKKKDNK